MKKCLFIITLIVIFFTQLFCNLPIEVPNDYPTIQEAINHAYTLSGSVTIEVDGGSIYYETLDIQLTSTGLLNLTLIGVDGAENCIIDGGNGQSVVEVKNNCLPEKFFKISGFTIRNSITSHGIFAHTSNSLSLYLDVEISDNIIQNCYIGIMLVRVNDCLVKDNTIINYSQIDPLIGISSEYVNYVIIDGNFISNFLVNISFLSSDGKVINNKIEVGVYSNEGIRLHSWSDIDIFDNLLLIDSGIKTGIYNGSSNNVKIINNTILGFGGFTNGYDNHLNGTTEKFVNNIMWNLDQNILTGGSNVFEVNYCCYNGTIPPECEPLPEDNHNKIDEYPLFEDPGNNTLYPETYGYGLILGSPCIDTGDKDTDGDGLEWEYDEDDRDIDGSRKDMGCFPYLHDYDTKHFDEGVHWVSFPVLTLDETYVPYPPNPSILPINYQLFQQAYYENDDPGLLQDESGTTGTIDGFEEILGNRYGTGMSIDPVLNDYGDGDDEFNNMLFRHEGYKIVVGEVTNPTPFIVGNGVGAERLPADHVIAGSMEPGEYHWIGYWLLEPQNMIDAFGFGTENDLWQYVEKVKSEDWYYNKCSIPRGDTTTKVTKSAKGLTMEYGKTYMVWFKDQSIENFEWYTSSTVEEPKEKAKSENFTYTEEPDYEAIEVFNIPSNVIEIGVFEDDVCVGAVVVEDTCAQILAYSDNANRDPIPFTFEVVTGRGFSTPIKNFQVMDLRTGQYESRSIISGRQEYSVIRFGNEDEPENNTLSTPQLHGNYPNPFNPTTTIEFSLVQTSQFVTLEIFNIKGQKVKTLYKGIAEEGKHSVIWEGKDTNGKSVSTGIYFYKLKTGKKEISRKMLLLK